MDEGEHDASFPEHKLCGFILAVLSISSLNREQQSEVGTANPTLLSPGTSCSLVETAVDAGFIAEDGTLLLPIPPSDGNAVPTKGPVSSSPSSSLTRRRRRSGIGLVKGSMSVVYQLHALVVNKCLKVRAKIVAASERGNGNARAVLLVDLYLPLAAWSGWQFPKSGASAASLFRHVSCNWKMRALLHACNGGEKSLCEEHIWQSSYCHVLGCRLHSDTPDSKRKLFDLHEIFKSLPSIVKKGEHYCTQIIPECASDSRGIWDISDDILTAILSMLGAKDLVNVAASCQHLKLLASNTIPYLKLKLFPHQQGAVEWMLYRERDPQVLPHPAFLQFETEDGFKYFVNGISGQISSDILPTINDFRGGMFCDEPGLGKTVTALSLILKTRGNWAQPPNGVNVIWCTHNHAQRCGYYEVRSDITSNRSLLSSCRFRGQNVLNEMFTEKRLLDSTKSDNSQSSSVKSSFDLRPSSLDTFEKLEESVLYSNGLRETQCFKGFGRGKKGPFEKKQTSEIPYKNKSSHTIGKRTSRNCAARSNDFQTISKKKRKSDVNATDLSDTWVQCDACKKWRRLPETSIPNATNAWFCSMNSDHLHQSCKAPEESWNNKELITYFPGFYSKENPSGNEQNVSFFLSILKENFSFIDSRSKKVLHWLSELSSDKLAEMETHGLTLTGILSYGVPSQGYEKLFEAFGLIKKVYRGINRWFYPRNLNNLTFDTVALQIALSKPLDSLRLYLSKATLIVVPSYLIEHWKTQIQKVVGSGQLKVFIWSDSRKPPAHNLAWDYDVVITTFNRLSAEWGPNKKSVLMQVHWFRIMLDEGHTLGLSLCLTNKLQMAISLTASSRWILTGTPTPDTPSSQLAHLHPILKFLHEEAYGKNQETWDAGILKPFEAEMEEGRVRLLELLKTTMISSRKEDIRTLPPCIKKVTFLHFSEEHAKSYNELVTTVRRNILMADWNDPSHIESLLNPKQWKFRCNTVRNIRLSCCVAGHIKVTEAGHDIQDTMDILAQEGLEPDSEKYGLIKSSLLYGGSCSRCKEWSRLPIITPCRHLLCLECVASDSKTCTSPGCEKSYEMQFPETRPENPNPKWPVPKDLIELQPSYRQDNWDPDWQSTSSSKVAYLVQRLKDLEEANNKSDHTQSGTETEIAYRLENCDSDVTKKEAYLNIHKASCLIPIKVIIFSQFLEHIHVIEQQLSNAGIKHAGMYSPMHSSNKMKSLINFQSDANCLALIMDGSAALGLDLSFATHVFLMEPIWDRSMEEQVISRAHRMGATRPINVETLAMQGTIEEQMVRFLQYVNKFGLPKQDMCHDNFDKTQAQHTVHDFAQSNYLLQLRFVRMNSNQYGL